MRDSNVANAAKESTQREFSHGLQKFCSTPCKRKAQNARAYAASGVLKATRGQSQPRQDSVPLEAAENKGSPRTLSAEDLLNWTLGKRLGGEPDERKFQARLYPADKSPFLFTRRWAYAVNLTGHLNPHWVGWYVLVKGRDENNLAFEYGPCATAERAKAVVEEYLATGKSPADREGREHALEKGSFWVIVSGAPSGAASVARGLNQ
jgi:hypothetical protein